MGYHRRSVVNWHHDRAFSECGYCGADLIRSRRGWRAARQEELPEQWRSQNSDIPDPVMPPSRWRPIFAVGLLLFVSLAVIATLKFA